MALSFLSLPPEVRNQIYGYVFNKEHLVAFKHYFSGCDYYPEDDPVNHAPKCELCGPRTNDNAGPSVYTAYRARQPPSFYTAMLQTSSQIYRETCCFLYAKTVFHYSFSPDIQLPSPAENTRSVFPKESLQHVKDLKIRHDRMIPVPRDVVVKAIAGFVDEACALERLTVEFHIYGGYIYGPDVAWVQSVLHNESVLKSLTTSKSLRYIRITVRDGLLHDEAGYAALSQATAAAKGWVCEARYHNSEPDKIDSSRIRSDWSWQLRPASQEVNARSVELIS